MEVGWVALPLAMNVKWSIMVMILKDTEYFYYAGEIDLLVIFTLSSGPMKIVA